MLKFRLAKCIFTALICTMGLAIPATADSVSDILNLDFLVKNIWNGSIPFPPQKIVDDILKLNPEVRVDGTVFSHGRSPERFFTLNSDDARTIFTWRFLGLDQDRNAAAQQSNTFIAYTPAKHELEVIQYNPGLKEFEFKLVENYGTSPSARLKTVDKAACISCHQHGQPIFPIFPWSESDSTPTDSQKTFVEALRKNTKLDEFAKIFANSKNPRVQNSVAQMDPLIRIADEQFYAAQTCSSVCNGSLACKQILIQSAIFNRFELCTDPDCVEFLTHFQSVIPKSDRPYAEGTDSLPDREPGVDFLNFTPEQDALTPRLSPLTNAQFPSTLAFVYAPLCLPFSFSDRSDLETHAEQTLKLIQSPAMTQLLSADGMPTVSALMKIFDPQSRVPAEPRAVVRATELGFPTHPDSHLFVKYCSSCHASATLAPTLPLDNLILLKSFVGKSSDQRTVLKLISASPILMPPSGAPQPSAQELKSMIVSLSGAIVPPPSPLQLKMPSALNTCIGCHSGSVDGAPILPFGDAAQFCALPTGDQDDLIKSSQRRMENQNIAKRMPLRQAALSQSEEASVVQYLSGLCPKK